MTPAQQTLVQASFAKVVPIADTAATLFYDDLFRRDPRLRALFKADMTEQRRKLMSMIGTAVANLGNWASIAPAVAALGQRHAAYGVNGGGLRHRGKGPDRHPGEGTWAGLHAGRAGGLARLLRRSGGRNDGRGAA